MSSSQFTAESVLSLYEQIQFGASRHQRDEANKQIFEFTSSQQAWQIAVQLLEPQRSQQDQFIGAQVLYKKLENHFEQIESRDAQVLEVRNTLFALLPQTYSRRVVMDRLCMGIALLALKTTNTCWQTSVADIMKHGSASAEQCFVSLLLLKYIPDLIENHCLDRKSKFVVQNYARDNLKSVLGYFAQVLNQQGLPQECYLEALSGAKAWCQFSSASYVVNLQFSETLLKLLQTPLFAKAVKVVMKLLSVSTNAKSLHSIRQEDAISLKDVKPDDRVFLEQVVITLQQLLPRFKSNPFVMQYSEEGDESAEGRFARKYVSLVTCLCSNYENLLVPQSELSQNLFGIVKECSKAPNLRLSILALEFWADFKETMKVCNLTDNLHLLNQFKEVSEIMLGQSVLIPSIPYDQLLQEEIEELEVTEKGVSMVTFREHTSDILINTFLLLQKSYGEQGEQAIYDILLKTLRQGFETKAFFEMEVCLFAARSIYDGFDDQNWNQSTLQFLRVQFQFVVQTFGSHFVLIRQALLVVQEMASALVEMKEHISPVLEYCLTAAKNERLRSLALNAVEQMSIYCQVHFQQADTQLLFAFMQESYGLLSVEHAQKVIKAAGNVASMLNDQIIFTAIEKIFALPLADIKTPQADRQQLLKALSVLRSFALTLKDLPSAQLNQSLSVIFTNTWEACQSIFQTRLNDSQLIDANCDFIVCILQILPSQISVVYPALREQLLNCFVQSPTQNHKCLDAYTKVIASMGKKNPEIRQMIVQSLPEVYTVLIPVVFASAQTGRIDPEMLSAFVAFTDKVIEVDAIAFVTGQHFLQLVELICQSATHIVQVQLTSVMASFFLHLVEKANPKVDAPPQVKMAIMNLYEPKILPALIALVPNDMTNTTHVTRISQSLVFTINQLQLQGVDFARLKQMIINAFSVKATLQEVPDEVKSTVAEFCLAFSDKLMKIRLCLQTLCWLVNGQGQADSFIGLELQAKQHLAAKSQSVKQDVIEI